MLCLRRMEASKYCSAVQYCGQRLHRATEYPIDDMFTRPAGAFQRPASLREDAKDGKYSPGKGSCLAQRCANGGYKVDRTFSNAFPGSGVVRHSHRLSVCYRFQGISDRLREAREMDHNIVQR